MIETPSESGVYTAIEEYLSTENFHSDIVVDDEGYIINSPQQTVEQIEVIQEVVLPEVSKSNHSVIKKGNETQFSFLQMKESKKRKMGLSKGKMDSSLFLLLPPNDMTPIDVSCYKLIDSSVLQKCLLSASKRSSYECRINIKYEIKGNK